MFITSLKNNLKQFLTPKDKLIILTYHQVTDMFNNQLHSKGIWSQSAFFSKQLQFVKNNYEILPLMEAIQLLKEGRIKGTVFCFSFDDGDKSLEYFTVPILEQHQIPATFFINSAYLSEKKGYWFNIFYHLEHSDFAHEFLNDEIWQNIAELRKTNNTARYLVLEEKIESYQNKIAPTIHFYTSSEFLANLNTKLFSIGLHGHEHQRFSMKDINWQERNLQLNIDALSKFPAYVPVFAIPFGKPHDWNEDTISVAKSMNLEIVLANAGYQVKYTKALMRFSADNVDVSQLMKNLSPFVKNYYRMNKLGD